MIKIFLREFLIFALSISIFPATFLLLILRGDIDRYGLMIISRELLSTGSSLIESIFMLTARALAPYALIQAFRAFQWSKTGKRAKRWAYLYYALLSGIVAAWFISEAWNLFYFMLQLGDIPGELLQFLKLEYSNLLAGLAGLYVSIRCLRISLNLNN